MLDFYTLQEVLKMLTESSNDKYTYTATDIATLCKQGVLTPVFGYAGYAIEVIEDKNTGRNPEWRTTSFYDGHLTNKRLLSLLDKSKNKLELSNAVTYKRDGKSYEVVLVANPLNIHKYLSDDNYSLYSDDDDYTVTRESLLFPSKQVKSYIASKQTAEQSTTEQQRIAELETELADLQNQLAQVNAVLTDKPADDLKDVPHQSYRTVARVMYAMAQLANVDNSKPFSQNKPSLNASITTILQNDGVPLESEAVGKWLSRINDIKPLK